jgi:hypothetical protein
MTMFLSQATFQPMTTGSRRGLKDVCRIMEQHEAVAMKSEAVTKFRHLAS